MLNEKKIKSIIIIFLLLIETFVWTAGNPASPWFAGPGGGQKGLGANMGSSDGPGSQMPPAEQQEQNGGQGEEQDGEPGKQDEPESYPPAGDEERDQALMEAEEKGLLILVNKENPVGRDYKPDDLTEIKYYVPDRAETTRYLRAEAAEAFHRLVDKAAAEGLEIKMTTAYRSYDFQKILFDNYVAKEGEEKANTFSARPGQSEHQTGLAVDVSSPVVDWQLSNDYGNTEEGKWIAANAHQFGFILRFPKGKEEITGYQYEPWHLRYVGLTAAKEIYENNLTLEEFLVVNGIE